MRTRAAVAAAAGIAAAAAAHMLDAGGQLPFVHETASVRLAMGPAVVVGWLLLAGALAALAVCTRVLLVGAPAAVLVSATPELIGRHDVGALAEPGALLGALLQMLLLLAVVAAAVLVRTWFAPRLRRVALARVMHVPSWSRCSIWTRPVPAVSRPRAPPAASAH